MFQVVLKREREREQKIDKEGEKMEDTKDKRVNLIFKLTRVNSVQE